MHIKSFSMLYTRTSCIWFTELVCGSTSIKGRICSLQGPGEYNETPVLLHGDNKPAVSIHHMIQDVWSVAPILPLCDYYLLMQRESVKIAV